MLSLFAYDYVRARRDDFAREAQQERLADLLEGDASRRSRSTADPTIAVSGTTTGPTPVEVRRPFHGRRGRSLVNRRMR